MNLGELFVAELEQEAVATRTMLDRVPEEKYGWRPHPRGQSAGQLAWHIAVLPGNISEIAVRGTLPYGFLPDRPEPKNKAELLQAFDDSLARARASFASMAEDGLHQPWKLMRGEEVVFAQPKHAFLRSILFNHWYHHRGQLSTYLRALDVKVPATYGPSGDENPFG